VTNSPKTRSFRVGIDIGGTFSDLVVVTADGQVSTLKVSSDPARVVEGLVDGLRQLLDTAGLLAADAAAVVHGTTIATNAILEYRGARTALITTRGFRDVLEIRRLRIGRLYDLGWEKPPALVPRRLRFEVTERADAEGAIILALDPEDVDRAISEVERADVEAVAVNLLHSYVADAHERAIGAALRERLPRAHLSLSSDVLPEAGEYERTSTTVINAYVGPVVDRYLGRLEEGLRASGVPAPLQMMQSNGGIMRADSARHQPIHIIESGPAAGVVAALEIARQIGASNLITVDMGGTTAKGSIIEDGKAFQMAEYEVGAGINSAGRIFKGGGHLLRVPALDIAEVGAGGGSLVKIDEAGGLRVGPASAGAFPGPACYGLGNDEPTLTDANVVLGYLNNTHLLGGTLPIDAAASERALRDKVANPLGLDLHRTAYGVHQVAVSNMVRVARAVSSERGRDPRRCSLLAFGGNGPVHAVETAKQLGITDVIVPPWPGLFSAFGLLAADTRHEHVRAHRRALASVTAADLADAFRSLEIPARDALIAEGHPDSAIRLQREVDLRYRGQTSSLRIPFDGIDATAAAFEAEHARTYGHHDSRDRIEIVNLRLVATAAARRGETLRPTLRNGAARSRPAYFGQLVETPIVDRGDLASPRHGPLIVEEYDATTIVPPGWSARLDEWGNIRLTAAR
jgi:N-methylhydantoinase A